MTPIPTVSETRQEARPVSPASRVRARALAIGVLLIPVNAFWVIMMERVLHGPYPTVVSIFVNTLFILTILIAINSIMKRLNPRWCFLTTAEMLVIYTMLTISSALAGHDMMPTLIAQIGWPTWRLNQGYEIYNTFMPALPKWLSVTDLNVLTPLYKGDASLYAHGYWRAWLVPALYLSSFMSVLVFTMMCMNTLVRRQWMEHERLTFPIVQLPLAMTEPSASLWRSKLFWMAFGITFGIELINGLSTYFPTIPMINLTERDHNLASNLTSLPWKAVGWLPYSFYPFMIGIGYLLPTDLCFSVWFFYLFWKVEKVVGAMLGFEASWDFPSISYQEYGGVLAIAVMLVWSSRGYLRQVWQRILRPDPADAEEPMSYRAAALGILLSLCFMTVFMRLIGMSPLVTIAAFGAYFVLAIVITRIRAELGSPVHDMPFGPHNILPSTMGADRFSHGDLVGLSYFQAFHGSSRAHPMPIGLEGMKMAQSTRASQRKFLWAMVIAGALGAIVTFWAYLHLGYAYGLGTKWNYSAAWAWEVSKSLTNWFDPASAVARPDWTASAGIGVGFLICLGLSAMRMQFFNWPFHPIGFVISGTYQANLVWVPLLIAWVVKTTILRYGGLKVYRSALPLFFGLIVGELTMGCLWGIVGIIGVRYNLPYYNFFGA